MPALTTIENAIVQRLTTAVYQGQPLLAVVEGASGPYRSAIRQALSRERVPAAYIAFIEERTSPETKPIDRGPRFSVLLADRALRVTSDPRRGDTSVRGVFLLIEQTRLRLDNYFPIGGSKMVPLLQRFADADDRFAVYEILYIVRPYNAGASFASAPLGGAESEFEVVVGPPDVEAFEFAIPGIDGVFRHLLADRGRELECRGLLRAATDAAVDALEAALDIYVRAGTLATFTDPQGRSYPNCNLVEWSREGPRRPEPDGPKVTQPVHLTFRQVAP